MANERKSKKKKQVPTLYEQRRGYREVRSLETIKIGKTKETTLDLIEQSNSFIHQALYTATPYAIAAAKIYALPLNLLQKTQLEKVPEQFRYSILDWYRNQPFAQLYKSQYLLSPGFAKAEELTLGDIAHQGIATLESSGPQFISWMQPSAMLSPFLISPDKKEIIISPFEIVKDLDYWEKVIDSANYPGYFKTIKEDLMSAGIVLKDGVPYINDGTFTRTVAPKARIAQKFLTLERGQQLSQAWLAHRVRITGEYHPGSYKTSWGLLLGKSEYEIKKAWLRSIGRSYMLRYFRTLDDPLEFLTEVFGIETGLEDTQLYKLVKNKIGAGGAAYYGKPILSLIGRHIGLVSKNIVAPYFVGKTIHETIKDIPFPGNAGIFTPVVWGLTGLDFARATIGTPFRYMADSLDKLAPGTASLGVAFGNVTQVGITAYFVAKSFNYLRKSDFYRSIYSTLDRYAVIPEKVDEIIRPIQKLRYFQYKTAKTFVLPESILTKIPEQVRQWIPETLQKMRATPAGKVGILAGLATLALSPLNIIGGTFRLLGGKKDLGELIDEYTGKKKVPVYTSRFWLFGQTPFWGQDAAYMGENWFNRMIHDYRQKTLFRNNEPGAFRAIKQTPIVQDIIAPYYVEEANYRSQPYPITGPSQDFLGFIGPIYAATVGQLFKPTRYMHQNEWAMTEEYLYKKVAPYAPQAFTQDRLYKQTIIPNDPEQVALIAQSSLVVPSGTSLGTENQILNVTKAGQGRQPSVVENPYSLKITAAKTVSYLGEAIGLPGYAFRIAVADPETWYTKYFELENAANLTSMSEQFYYANLGDPGYTEAIRRIIMNTSTKRKPFDLIPNDQPYWMPDAGFYIKMRHGDPYRNVTEGYARVPGPGLTERLDYRHLKGVPYEEYPLEDRLKILGDIAYTSEEFKETYAALLYKLNNQFIKDPYTIRAIKEMQRDFVEKLDSREFLDYGDKVTGPFKLQYALNRLSTPIGELLFTSPKEKFSIFETPIEAYKHRVIQGNESAIWSHPWRDFIRPFFGRVLGLFTDEPMPWVKEHRTNEMYLDYLKYFKFSIAANQALQAGNVKAADKFKQIAATTAVAVNPYKSIFELLPAIPKEERPYFIKFASETDPHRREKILEMTSPVMKRIYKARWELLDYATEAENAPSKQKLREHIAFARKREEELMNLDIVREAREMPKIYGPEYTLPDSGWEGYTMQHSMTELKVGFLQSIDEDPVDYRIPRREIQMLNSLGNPEEVFTNVSEGPDLLNYQYAMTQTLFRRAKNIIYRMSNSESIPTTVMTLEYRPKVKYVWERDN